MKISFVAAALAVALAVPLMASAQSTGLAEAIRSEIMKDPRSASIPQTQMDAMVASLAQTAAQQGVTESDITWRPVTAHEVQTAPARCDFFCAVNQIFGFEGKDFSVPIGLGATSALLILFISMMFHRHHLHGVEPTIESIHGAITRAPKKATRKKQSA